MGNDLFYLVVAGFFTGFVAGLRIFKNIGCGASLLLAVVTGIFSSFLLGFFVFPILLGGVINPIINRFSLNYKSVYGSLLAIFMLIAIALVSQHVITYLQGQYPKNRRQSGNDETLKD